MRPLVEEGHIYIAQPPLYKIERKKSKDIIYLYSDEDLQAFLREHEGENLRYSVTRG